MRFEHIETNKTDSGGGGNFLKLGDGENISGVLRGSIYRFYQAWPQGGQKQIFEEPTAGAGLRFRVNFVTLDTLKPLVWEFGVTVNNQLAEYSEEMDLSKTKIKVSRRGTGKSNTTWTVIPLGAVDAKALKQIEVIPLNVLEHKPEPF